MAKEKTNPVEEQAQNTTDVFTNDVNLSLEVREEINAKAEELKKKSGLKKVFVIVVNGDESDPKPLYIGYFRRPNLMEFSRYMSFVQKDIVQANKMLATDTWVAGDKELVDDDDLFLYGTMQQLGSLIDSRNAAMLKR
jgi:hypothetical protein